MAEAFGVVASGLGVASLAIQIVREPHQSHQLLRVHQGGSSRYSATSARHSLPETSEAITRKCLGLVRHDISKLSSLSLELERKLNSEKRITPTWARVQTILSENKIATLRGHLKRAKSGLQLLQCCHIFEDIRTSNAMSTQTPQEDHVKIDDGLEKLFYLPFDLCSSPQGFIDILSHKYKSEELPGLTQIERGHFGVFDWDENKGIDLDNWSSVVKGRSGIKLAFIMTTWHGFPRNKCMRCYKPRERGTSQRYSKCTSCGLELPRVDTDAIPFETEDITIGLSPDQYRDYTLASRQNSIPTSSPCPPILKPSNSALANPKPKPRKLPSFYANPPIDAVCKRLIVKWEPMLNFVHRYLHCRCILRLSTPSHIEKEQTFLTFALCPRHNTRGVSYLDYGNIDYNTDQYFARFGGYKAFQGIIYMFAGNIYETLGGERFLSKDEKDGAVEAFDEFWKGDLEGFKKLFLEYMFEINDKLEREGFELPDEVVRGVREERLKRQSQDAEWRETGLHGLHGESLVDTSGKRMDLRDIPMVKEVNEILDGKWNGKPHWALDD
ncbi:hypothetical protein N431DRAFT_516548 [Stipitochalara longipes BDJ]|nr:hypothetical protein N431DRAFT_516548 [Stipitochalara longipes BDJ]